MHTILVLKFEKKILLTLLNEWKVIVDPDQMLCSFLLGPSPDYLTHCILNRLSDTIYWKSQISILGMSAMRFTYS